MKFYWPHSHLKNSFKNTNYWIISIHSLPCLPVSPKLVPLTHPTTTTTNWLETFVTSGCFTFLSLAPGQNENLQPQPKKHVFLENRLYSITFWEVYIRLAVNMWINCSGICMWGTYWPCYCEDSSLLSWVVIVVWNFLSLEFLVKNWFYFYTRKW